MNSAALQLESEPLASPPSAARSVYLLRSMALLFCVLVALWALLQWVLPVPESVSGIVTGLGAIFLYALAVLLVLRSAKANNRAWQLFGLAFLTNLAATACRLWLDQASSFNWIVLDIVHIGLMAAAVLSLPSQHQDPASRRIFILDTLFVSSSALLLIWVLAISSGSAPVPAYSDGDNTVWLELAFFGVLSALTINGLTYKLPARGASWGFILLILGLFCNLTAGLLGLNLSQYTDWLANGLAESLGLATAALYLLAVTLIFTSTSTLSPQFDSAEESPLALWFAPSFALLAWLAAIIKVPQVENPRIILVIGGLLLLMLMARSQMRCRRMQAFSGKRTVEISEHRLATLVKHANDAVLLLTQHGKIEYVSPSASRMLASDPAACTGRFLSEFLKPDDRPTLADILIRAVSRPGEGLAVGWRVQPKKDLLLHTENVLTSMLHDPAVNAIVLNARDVTKQRQLEHKLRQLAVRDPLTGLANRSLLQEQLAQTIRRLARTPGDSFILVADVDRFTLLNESLGSSAGDFVLKTIASRLSEVFQNSLVARLADDAFCVLCEGVLQDTDGRASAKRLRDAIQEPIFIDGQPHRITAAIGVALMTSEDNADQVVARGLQSLQRAKLVGRGRMGRPTAEIPVLRV